MGISQRYVWELGGLTAEFQVSANSDRGRVRAVNEDSSSGTPPIFLVADGMGGHAFGDRASQATARVLSAALAVERPVTTGAVLDAIRKANAEVLAIATDGDYAGTTLAGIALVASEGSERLHWMVFNIGDSRVYRWDGVALEQVSVDHSAVQELVDDGMITAGEAATHPERNVITRAIGIDDEVDPDVWLMPAEGTHHFLICSDGLTKELDDRDIAGVLAVDGDASIADRLVSAALLAGGHDNVTVVSVRATVEVSTALPEAGADSVPEHLEATHPRR